MSWQVALRLSSCARLLLLNGSTLIVRHQPDALGIMSIDEIGIVGMNAAVANAVFNATGKRTRALLIRPERLF